MKRKTVSASTISDPITIDEQDTLIQELKDEISKTSIRWRYTFLLLYACLALSICGVAVYEHADVHLSQESLILYLISVTFLVYAAWTVKVCRQHTVLPSPAYAIVLNRRL